MDERYQRGLSPRQRKSIVIRIVLLFICVFILYGEYTMRNAENSNKEPKENAQDSPLAVETYEEENPVIMNDIRQNFRMQSILTKSKTENFMAVVQIPAVN